MQNLKEFFAIKKYINHTDLYILIMLLVYNIIIVLFWSSLASPAKLLVENLGLCLIVLTIAFILRENHSDTIRLLRRVYFFPIVFFIYSEINPLLKAINPYDYDWLLIKIDYSIFHQNPTQTIYKIANPYLTEYLQFTYINFYFLPILISIDLYLQKKTELLCSLSSFIILSFLVSYLMYFFLPAVGPRFTLHDFSSINTELPGIWLTEFFRNSVNAGGGVLPGMKDPINHINRDCMPSGHTMMTLITILLAFRYKSRVKYYVLIVGSSLIFATIYLRYHYVVDVIAGILCALLMLWLKPALNKFLDRHNIQDK